MVNLLHYELISEFKRQFYAKLITHEHLVGGQIMLKKLVYPDGGENDAANFWGYIFEKDKKKYLLSSVDEDGNEIKLSEYLPFMANGTQKVASRTEVYYMVMNPVVARFTPKQTMGFKQMVDTFCSLEHSNPDHQKLLWFFTLAQMMDRCNVRMSSNAGFGKDSAVDIMGNLIGGAVTVENPTLAKLEYLTHQKLLAINEAIDLKKNEWKNIEQFLLASGGAKPEITKHSRAVAGGVKEILDISKLSLSLMYNDVDHYPEKTIYFDYVTTSAVKDRFPAIRLHGRFTEDFNNVKDVNVKKYVTENIQKYKDLIYAYTYYKDQMESCTHNYDISRLSIPMSHRWKINLGKVLKIMDMYSDSQEEFNYFIDVLQNSLYDYKNMLVYPEYVDKLSKAMIKSEFEKEVSKINKLGFFTERIKAINMLVDEKRNYKDKVLEEII